MSGSTSEAVALLRTHLQNRRFDGRTLRVLESVLVARDVKCLLETRSALRELLQTEASSVMAGVSRMTVDQKLGVVQFFVGAFALVGDVENCLALKYEALILRESECLKYHDLQVSYTEWLTFAKDSLDNRFYPIAIQGFEKALHCIQSTKSKDRECFMSDVEKHIMLNNIKKLKDMASSLIATSSENPVQTQSAEYLKRKGAEEEEICSSCSAKRNLVCSSTFRDGMKKRSTKMLQRSRRLPSQIGHYTKNADCS